ncbi:MAG: hypothetical protein KDE26_24675, partial [Bacteroidetes bacterium]|nr:hypothetical protein [Bacteroidota bacterium]
DILLKEMDGGGYFEKQYFWINPKRTEDGFVLVSQIERVDDQGASKPLHERWLESPLSDEKFSIENITKKLANAEAGTYRVLVYTATHWSLPGGEMVAVSRGQNELADGKSRSFANQYNYSAKIYAFEVKKSGEKPVLLLQSEQETYSVDIPLPGDR